MLEGLAVALYQEKAKLRHEQQLRRAALQVKSAKARREYGSRFAGLDCQGRLILWGRTRIPKTNPSQKGD